MNADYVPTNIYGIRYVDPNDGETKLGQVYAKTEDEVRRIWSSMGPPHKPNYDVLSEEDYRELLISLGGVDTRNTQ